MQGDTELIREYRLTPLLNSVDQLIRHLETLPNHPFGIQLDTGMNRLGMEPVEWHAVRELALPLNPKLIMSHLACADDPDHDMNAKQLAEFHKMTDDLDIPKSLSATGGILLGSDYHFDLTRPGVGLYGGFPFEQARAVAKVNIPIIQTREVDVGETVGYSNTWRAPTPRRIATVSAGYADGIIRAMGGKTALYAGDVPCPIVGRISMDLIGVDVTLLTQPVESLELLNDRQTIDVLAENAGTIGYEILTSLGGRYQRRYVGDMG
jgi:alanine racemase